MLRGIVVVALLVLAHVRAYADTIALLPLDAEKRLEIYGQPVAAEIGRALAAEGYKVVVVGAKMDVPDEALLIVDGTIKSGANKTVALSVRIRDPHTGTTLETLPTSSATLTTIDKAAAELSSRLVPVVKTQLAALAAQHKAGTPDKQGDKPVDKTSEARPTGEAAATTLVAPRVLVRASVPHATPVLELLARGVNAELAPWATAHGRSAQTADDDKAIAGAELGIALDVLTFTVDPGTIPLARARVRARVVMNGKRVFDRVIRTDTVVGDRAISEQEMSARTAREVLAILNANLRRLVTGWR